MAKMTPNARFQRGSGCFPCGVCKRQTRNVGDNGGVELCPQCYELAGIENALSDAPESWPENPSEEKAVVWARYESEINEHLDKLRGFGIDVETVWSNLLGYAPKPVAVSEKVLTVVEPSLAKSLLERERAQKMESYVLMTTRLENESKDAAKRAIAGRFSTHDGINLSRLATEVATLAAVIESLDRCIASAK